MDKIDLGNAIVLDADKLFEGKYVEIEGHIFVVSETDKITVGLKPVIGWDYFVYHFKKYQKPYFYAGSVTVFLILLVFKIITG